MLIILSKSPWAENHDSILEIAKKAAENGEKTAVLLIQDTCTAATMKEFCAKLDDGKVEVYALKADCEARGLIDKLLPKIRVVDYRQWVELVMIEHDKIVSWTS